MTRKLLNTGTSANDGTGDTLREASEKINSNFLELYEITTLGDVTAEFLSNYVDSAVEGALTGVDLSGTWMVFRISPRAFGTLESSEVVGYCNVLY